MTRIILAFLCLSLAGCGMVPRAAPPDPGLSDGAVGQRPQARPEAGATQVPVSPAARTAEQFDTTTEAERKAAVVTAVSAPQETRLGTTVASLGDPARPGFWLETPLASAPGPGRVVFSGTGESVAVELIPIEGPDTAGSRVSLAAMRLLKAPLTGLPQLEVFAR